MTSFNDISLKLKADNGIDIVEPDPAQVSEIISRMDGNAISDIMIERKTLDQSFAMIFSGGVKDRVVVTFTDMLKGLNLQMIDNANTESEVEQLIRGTVTPVAGIFCVSKESAKDAAIHFIKHGELSSCYEWRQS